MIFRAKKSLGQNFLSAPQVIDDIILAGEIRDDDVILEIGPGHGVLTKSLLKTGARVVAVEKDDHLFAKLSKQHEREISSGQLIIIHGDILEISLHKVLTDHYIIIANIPYYITGAILRQFLGGEKKPKRMVLMVQKEVADRIIARDEKESVLSISVKVYGIPEIVRKVGRGSFRPVPGVDSALLLIRDIKNPFESREDENYFFTVLKSGFAQKRKKLSTNLESVSDREKITKTFSKLNLDSKIRAEDVPPSMWIDIARELS